MATINISDNSDSTIKVSPGDIIHITLSENPTTGYIWETKKQDKSQLQLDDDNFKIASTAAGSAGTRIFKFKVLAAGEGDLILENRQKWEKDVSRTFILKYKSE